MKSKQRMSWAKYHVYLSCFFLPLVLLYTLTGVLYLFDIHGDNSEEKQIVIEYSQPFPTDEKQAKELLEQHYPNSDYGSIKGEYYAMGNGHSWYEFDKEVMLTQENDNEVVIGIHIHGLWKKLVMIHKGHAHIGFWVLGIMLSISLLFSLISGVVLAFSNQRYQRIGKIGISCGVFIIIILYILPL